MLWVPTLAWLAYADWEGLMRVIWADARADSKALLHLQRLGVVAERTRKVRGRVFSYLRYVDILNEGMRRRLRDLIKLTDKQKRKPIYTDFEDAMGKETAVALPGFGEGTD